MTETPSPEIQLAPCPVESHDAEHIQVRTHEHWLCGHMLAGMLAASDIPSPLAARIGELEAENENLRHRADAMTVRREEARKLQTLVAELISVLREYGEDPAALERWRERAGLGKAP